MKYTILGAGFVGFSVASSLIESGHDVLLIEKDKERVSQILPRLDCKILSDEGERFQTLREAGIETSDYFLSVTNQEEVNLMACSIARKLNPHIKTLSRIRSLEYFRNIDELSKIFKVDYCVHPHFETAISVIRTIEYGGGVSDIYVLNKFKRVFLRSVPILPNSPIKGTRLADLRLTLNSSSPHFDKQFLVAFMTRRGESIIPRGDTIFEEGDDVYLLGEPDTLERVIDEIRGESSESKGIRKVMIVGASLMVDYLLGLYTNSLGSDLKLSRLLGRSRFVNRNITVIEKDLSRCEELSELYPQVDILKADYEDDATLREVELESADMVITATESQERNIILAAHSNKIGVKNTIALVNSHLYTDLAQELGVDLTVSVRNSVISSILNFAKGQKSLITLVGNQHDIIHVTVGKNSEYCFTEINKIYLPEEAIILCIKRGENVIIPRGEIPILEDDELLLIVRYEDITRIQKIFDVTMPLHHENNHDVQDNGSVL